MELYSQILGDAIACEILPKLQIDAEKILELRCYQAIMKIYEIVSNEQLDDPECFRRVEEIVCALDDLGIGGGGRHDFG